MFHGDPQVVMVLAVAVVCDADGGGSMSMHGPLYARLQSFESMAYLRCDWRKGAHAIEHFLFQVPPFILFF